MPLRAGIKQVMLCHLNVVSVQQFPLLISQLARVPIYSEVNTPESNRTRSQAGTRFPLRNAILRRDHRVDLSGFRCI